MSRIANGSFNGSGRSTHEAGRIWPLRLETAHARCCQSQSSKLFVAIFQPIKVPPSSCDVTLSLPGSPEADATALPQGGWPGLSLSLYLSCPPSTRPRHIYFGRGGLAQRDTSVCSRSILCLHHDDCMYCLPRIVPHTHKHRIFLSASEGSALTTLCSAVETKT